MSNRPAVFLLLPGILLVLAFYVLPIGEFLLGAIQWDTLADPAVRDRLTSDTVGRVFSVTLQISLLVSVIVTLLAVAIAYFINFHAGRWRRVILLTVLLSLWLSVLVRAFGLVAILRNNGLLNTLLLDLGLLDQPLALLRNMTGVIIGMVHYMLPIALLPLHAAFAGFDVTLIRSAQSMGAGESRTLLRIVLPVVSPAVIGVFLMSFVLCLGFYVTPAIMGGGRTVMVAEYISVQVQQLVAWSNAGVFSLVLLLGVALLFGLSLAFSRMARRRGGRGS